MQKFLAISKYKLLIIFLYIALLPLFFIFASNTTRYNFTTAQAGKIFLIIVGTTVYFYALNRLSSFRVIRWQNSGIGKTSLVLLYSLMFAVPEEIIFRGIIQGSLLNAIENTLTVVFISSLIFGLAHLPNGARGLHPKLWNWEFAVIAFLAGLPLSISFAATNSLLLPTFLHTSFLLFYFTFSEKPQKLL